MGSPRTYSRRTADDAAAAWAYGGAAWLLDVWLLGVVWRPDRMLAGWETRQAVEGTVVQTLGVWVIVLVGAAIGARLAGRSVTRAKRWRGAAAGALFAHLLPLAVVAPHFARYLL